MMEPSAPLVHSAPIRAEGVTKRFGVVTALDNVSVSVGAGEVFGLLGPDGAGKTTLMRVLCGLLAPDAGAITVAGFDMVTEPESAKQHLGYLPQRFGLWGDLTVEENLRFCADLYGVPEAEFRERRLQLLEITRLAPYTSRRAEHLSGGMRQKLALICTLIHRPQVLLLDEPTTGVDPASRRDFWALLHDLPEQGVTILISTPYMDEAERCHRVALLHEGRILACGTPAELQTGVQGQLLEVTATPHRRAKEVLRALPGVRAVTSFGDRLHALLDADGQPEWVADQLRDAQVDVVSVRPISPALEDVFTTLLARKDDHE